MRVLLKIAATLAVLLGASPAPGDASDMLRRAAPSVVHLDADDGQGTGVVVAPDVILTCEHVARHRAAHMVVVLDDGRRLPLGPTLRTDTSTDLALISVPGLKLPAVAVAKSDPELFEQLYGVGFPLGLARVAAPEMLATKSWGHGRWLLSGAISHGDSGGAVFNAAGELVCVIETTLLDGDTVPPVVAGACVGRDAVVKITR